MPPVWTNPLDPHERALTDYFAGDTGATLTIHSDLGEHDQMPAELFFREPPNLFAFEGAALEVCRGRVLDLGAGVGVHTLVLQNNDFDVMAVEILPGLCDILRARGVRHVVQADIRDVRTEPVDTVLMLMNGFGPVGTLSGLDAFLQRATEMLVPGGQILADGASVEVRDPPADGTHPDWPERDGEYVGEAWIRLEYQGIVAPPFRELYIDADTLRRHAERVGFTVTVIYEEPTSYVARLALL